MSSKWLVGTVCGALLLYAVGIFERPGKKSVSLASAGAAFAKDAQDPAASPNYEADYTEFGTELRAFCSGDGSNQEQLEEIARRMADVHGRRDAMQVVAYYRLLSPEARAAGLDAYAEVDAFHERAEGRNASDWQVERPELLADIERFVARTLPAPEFSAAGNALALASEIRVDWSAATHSRTSSGLANEERLLRAKRDALEALALFDRAGMQTPKLRPLLQLGRLAVLEAQEARARDAFERCLKLARDCRRTEYEVDALVALIHMARSAGDGPELESRLSDLARLRTPEESWELAREHAMLWLHRDQPEQAAEFLIRHRPDQPQDLRVWRQILTSVRLRMGDLEGAQSLFQSIEQAGVEDEEDWILLRSTLDLARGNPSAVIYRLQSTRNAITNFSDRGRSRAEVLLGEAQLIAGQPQLALEALGRARQLAESWEARMDEARPSAGTGAAVLGEWLGMHAIVLEARVLCQLDRTLEAAVLIERAHGFRWRDAARADRLANSSEPGSLDMEDLRAWAAQYPHGLITWISGANDALAIHVSEQGIATPWHIGLPRRDLKRAILRHREALLRGDQARHMQIGRELRDALFPPALLTELEVERSVPGHLMLLPHGELERLAFEALPWGGGYLDEALTLLALPELPSQLPGEPLPTSHAWSLIGDPLSDEGLARLPASRLELNALAQLRPNAERVTGPQLKASALLQALAEGRSLHIATHLVPFEACASPRFSSVGLEMSGGQALCAQAIASQSTTTSLVVLATCASGAGRHLDGRGLQGISRAFLDGGTRNLLVTLWPIRDDVAEQFSQHYHRLLLEGATPAQAAQAARRAIAAAGAEPVDWAAFRALGRD